MAAALYDSESVRSGTRPGSSMLVAGPNRVVICGPARRGAKISKLRLLISKGQNITPTNLRGLRERECAQFMTNLRVCHGCVLQLRNLRWYYYYCYTCCPSLWSSRSYFIALQWDRCLNGAARVCTEKFYARHPLIIPFPRNDLMRHYVWRIKLGRATVLKFPSRNRYAINFWFCTHKQMCHLCNVQPTLSQDLMLRGQC